MLNWTATIWPMLATVAIKGAVVLAAACMVTFAMRNRSAAARHLVWTACAAALLALPVLSVALPVLRLPAAGAILPGDAGLVFRSTVTAAQVPSGPTALAPQRTASRNASSRSGESKPVGSGRATFSMTVAPGSNSQIT